MIRALTQILLRVALVGAMLGPSASRPGGYVFTVRETGGCVALRKR